MAKPNLGVLGKTKQLLDPNLQITHFLSGIWTKCCQQKSHKSHKSRSFQSSIYKNFRQKNSAINHLHHQKIQGTTTWNNKMTQQLKRNKRALGLARRPQRGQRKQLRCNDSALRKRRASDSEAANMESSNISMDESRLNWVGDSVSCFGWQRRRAHMVCFPCFTCSTTNHKIAVKTVIS